MISLLIFLFILSVLIVVHEFGHFMAARSCGVKVEAYALGFGPKLCGIKAGDTEYSIRLFPLGGFVKLAGDNWDEFQGKPWEYLSKSLGQRLRILVAGPVSNYLLAFVFLWLVFSIGYPMMKAKVGDLLKDMPAKSAGILAGDEITAIDGTQVKFWDDVQAIVQKSAGKTITLSVIRDKELRAIEVPVEKREMTTIWGSKESIGLIGIVPSGEAITMRHGVFASFFLAGKKLFELTYVTCKGLVWLALRKMSVRESVTGPVGIFFIAKGAMQIGISAILHMMAVLSLSLSIFNMLPLPVLDGGHVVLLGLEKLRGRKFIREFDKVWTRVGLSFIIVLGVLVFFNDMMKFGVIEKITKLFGK